MIGDFFTKPLQGKKFEYFRDLILGKKSIPTMDIDDRSVLEEERILSAKNTDAEQTNLTQSRRDLAGK
jgi:myosin-crossreactive antigen